MFAEIYHARRRGPSAFGSSYGADEQRVVQRGEGGQISAGIAALLFALFVLALLIAIMVGTGLYRALVDARDQAARRVAAGLIANSVRAADAADARWRGSRPGRRLC